jgi:Rieske Fe-S protein
MAAAVTHLHGTVNRNRFMLGVMGGIGAVIGLFYLGSIVRYLYPKAGGDTPPLNVKLAADGVTDTQSGGYHSFKNGVAGPIIYPMSEDQSVVVGVFVEKKAVAGPLSATNLMVVEQTCTHLGCPVAWTPADNLFECPCHGSAFNRDASVHRGPALLPLMQHEFTLAGDTLTIGKRTATI